MNFAVAQVGQEYPTYRAEKIRRGNKMQWYTIVYVTMMLALGIFLTVGGCILERDKDWQRVWKSMGKPDVKSIKELKALREDIVRNP